MLSDSNIRKINDQIARELETVESWIADNDDKTAALKRIAKLKALLMPQPSREEILQELADAIVNVEHAKPSSDPTSELLGDLVNMFRRR